MRKWKKYNKNMTTVAKLKGLYDIRDVFGVIYYAFSSCIWFASLILKFVK